LHTLTIKIKQTTPDRLKAVFYGDFAYAAGGFQPAMPHDT
jgi:hypothetical protein